MTAPRSCGPGSRDAANRETSRLADGVGGLRDAEQRLRGNAAVLQAVAAHRPNRRRALGREGENVLLRERDAGAEPRSAGGDDEAARAGTDHDEVVTFHLGLLAGNTGGAALSIREECRSPPRFFRRRRFRAFRVVNCRGRLAQRESVCFTRSRSRVRSPHLPPAASPPIRNELASSSPRAARTAGRGRPREEDPGCNAQALHP